MFRGPWETQQFRTYLPFDEANTIMACLVSSVLLSCVRGVAAKPDKALSASQRACVVP